ncbi:MAG: peptidase S16 [Dehalococcoidia bacterium]|nr:peptidase S16 [Dehalococcoidia bacterium]
MMSSQRRLPLFPLNTVLFPQAAIPLQIFEERYKLMLEECLESDSRFGVTLIREGAEVGEPAVPHEVGTVARIVQVNRIEGDRFFVSAIGERRFRVIEITQHKPFISAQVELLDEFGDEPVPENLIIEATDRFGEYARYSVGTSGGWVSDTKVPTDPAHLSYHIAGKVKMDLSDRQLLLEQESAEQRLAAEIDMLKRNSRALRQQMAWQLLSRFSRQ